MAGEKAVLEVSSASMTSAKRLRAHAAPAQRRPGWAQRSAADTSRSQQLAPAWIAGSEGARQVPRGSRNNNRFVRDSSFRPAICARCDSGERPESRNSRARSQVRYAPRRAARADARPRTAPAAHLGAALESASARHPTSARPPRSSGLLSNDVRLVGDGFCLPPDADSPFWHEAAELLTSRLDTREYLPHELAELAQELETLDITHVSSKLYLGTLSAGCARPPPTTKFAPVLRPRHPRARILPLCRHLPARARSRSSSCVCKASSPSRATGGRARAAILPRSGDVAHKALPHLASRAHRPLTVAPSPRPRGADDGVAQFTVPPNAPIGDGELLADAVNFMRTRSPCLVISDSGADAAAVMCAAMLAAEQGLDATAALAAVEARGRTPSPPSGLPADADLPLHPRPGASWASP